MSRRKITAALAAMIAASALGATAAVISSAATAASPSPAVRPAQAWLWTPPVALRTPPTGP